MALTSEQWKSLEDMAQQIGQETIANGLGSPTAQATGSPTISTQNGPRELYNQLWEMRRQQAEAAKAESVEQRRERVRSNFLATAQEIQDQQRNRGSASEESATPTQTVNETSATQAPKTVQEQNLEYLEQVRRESLNPFTRFLNSVSSGVKNSAAQLASAGANLAEIVAKSAPAVAKSNELTQKALGRDTEPLAQKVETFTPEKVNKFFDETQKRIEKVYSSAEKDRERAQYGLGKVGKTAVDVGVAGTQMLGDIAATALTGGTNIMPLLAARSYGGGVHEARQSGANLGQQVAYGAATAAVEAVTEKISDVLGIVGGGASDDVARKVISKLAQTDTGRTVLRVLSGMGGEAVEEIVSDAVNPAIRAIYDSGAAAQESYGTAEGRKELAADAAYSGLIGAVLGGIGGTSSIATGKNAQELDLMREADAERAAAKATPTAQVEANQGPTTRNPLYEAFRPQTAEPVAENATTTGPSQTPQNAAQAQEAPVGEITPPTAPNAQGEAGAQPQAAETAQTRLERAQARYAELERAFDNYEVSDADADDLSREMEQAYNEIQELTPLAERERQSAADVQTQQARVQNGEVSKGYGTPENHIDRRTPESVGNVGMKSFQFDNPQLHGYYVEAAQALFDEVQRAEDAALWRSMSRERGSAITGPVRRLMDMGLTKPQIVKCLQDIIADNGQENYAAAKRVELVLNDMLTNGWQGQLGRNDWHEANADYIAAKDAINGGIKADSWEKYLADHELSLMTGEVTEDELRQEWEQMHPQEEAATATEPESAPGPAQPVEAASTEGGQAAQNGTDSRGYTGPLVDTQDRVFETQLTEDEKKVPGLTAEEARHIQHHDAEVDARAKARIAAGAEQARAELLAAESWSDEDTATAGYLIQAELDAADNAATPQERANIYKRLAELKKQWNKQGTEEGRALRQRRRFVAEDIVTSAAETLYGNDAGRGGKALRKLNPQAKDQIMRTVRQYAQRFNDIQKNHPGDAASIIQLIKDVSVQRRTTGLLSNQNSRTVYLALEQVAQQEGGVDFLNDLLTTQIKSIASDYIKPGIIDQLKSFRFMNMLSNLATVNTNFGANTTFGSIMEPIASAPSAMMDSFMAHFTGQRTVPLETVAQAKTGWNGFRDAGLRSFLEVTLDAEAEQASYGYKEIKGSTFKMVGNPLERLLATMQKWQGYALKTPDQAAKGSARAKVSEGLNRLAESGKTNADNIGALAEREAKYRTLQSDGEVSKLLQGGRRLLDNAKYLHIGNDKTGTYGLGTDIMPFAQVPANAVATSLEAHPVIGGAKAAIETFSVIHDALSGQGVDPAKQARAARAWGHAANGVVVAATFAALAARGHIRDKEDDDKNVQAQRRAEGQGTLQLNISSTLRDIAGQGNEAREGDKYIDFSWIPQLNLLANFGVDLYNAYRENGKITKADVAAATWDSLTDSIMEFPAVSKVSSLIQTYKYSENQGFARALEVAATSAAETASSVLIPNAVRAAAAGADPYERDVYNTDTYGQGIKNNLIAGIPGLRQTLPERLDTFGNPVRNSGGPLHFLDKTVIPGNVEVDNRQSAESKAIENLIKATGDKSLQPSRNAPGKLTIDGEDVQLSAADKRLYKQKEGQLSQRYIGELMKDDIFKSLSPEDQAAAVKELYSAAKEQAKSAVADSLGKKDKPGAFQKLLSGVVNPGNGTDNDIPKLQSRNLAQYTSYDVAFKNAVKRGDTAAIDNLLMRFSRLNGNTQSVITAKNPGENDGNGINNLLKYMQAGSSSKSYFAVKDAINDAQIELDKSAKTGGDVKLWGLGSAGIPASEKDKLVESGAFNLSSAAKNTYTILRNAGLSASEIATWFDNADYFSKGEGIEAKSDGSLNAYEVATAISKMDSLSEPEKSALYLEFKAALQEKGSPYDTWKEKTYEQALGQSTNYGRTVGKPKQESSGNVFYDYYKERAKAQK